jgi:hypothetical protein
MLQGTGTSTEQNLLVEYVLICKQTPVDRAPWEDVLAALVSTLGFPLNKPRGFYRASSGRSLEIS